MRLPARYALATAAAVLLAACGGAARTPSPSPTPNPVAPWLRATTSQALPPLNVFAVGPTAVVTADGTYVTAGPVPEIDPAPLLPSLVGRSLTDAGKAAILAEADRLGLIGRKTDFRGVAAMPGGVLGHLELTVDGKPLALTGEPDSKMLCILPECNPVPGTPEAFGEFWREVAAPAEWLDAELGPEGPFTADSYAILVGPPPDPDPAAGAQVQTWPLDAPISTFGVPVASNTHRCGIVTGADAETLRPALEAANQRTQWTEDETTSAAFGITVRPIVAGEDPCAETFGPG